MMTGIIIVPVNATVGFVASVFTGWCMGFYGQSGGGWHHMGRRNSGDGHG